MKEKTCKICGTSDTMKGKRYCHTCFLARVREQGHKRGRWHRLRTCPYCHKEFKAFRDNQIVCRYCKSDIKSQTQSSNKYVSAGGDYCWEHRKIAEFVLGKLNTDQVVHHVDCDPTNNDLSNLWVMTRSQHARLHSYLVEMKIILGTQNTVNHQIQWDKIIKPISEIWLTSVGIKVIKLMDHRRKPQENWCL